MYNTTVSMEEVNVTIEALKKNGINAIITKNGEDAKEKVLAMIPLGSQIMTMTSVTLDTLGIAQEINESGKFDSEKKMMDKNVSAREKKMLGAAPEYTIGSVHAVTQ